MMMTTNSKKSAQAVKAGEQGVRVATYSEKSFCVFGDTYPIRKMLKAAKLGYNPRLKCGPGWLGSNKRKEAILQLLGVKLETLTEAELIAIGEQRKAESEQQKAD
jgi:hypothetical protein